MSMLTDGVSMRLEGRVLLFGTVVLLRHGEYYTVYANLGSCSVSTGQKLKQGQTLGTVASGGDLAPTIHFEVWKQRTRLNPSEWLR